MAVFEAAPSVVVDRLGARLGDVFASIEVTVQARIARYAYRGLVTPPDLLERLRIARALEDHARRLVSDPAVHAAAEAVIADAAAASVADLARQLDLAGVVPRVGVVSGVAANAVAAVQLDLFNRLDVLTERVVRYAGDAYQRIAAMTVPDMLVGGATLQSVQERMVQTFLGEGITGFIDRAGRRWRVGSYAEMSARTASVRAWTGAAVTGMQAVGLTLVRPIGGRSACPLCAPWHDTVLSTDGAPAGVYQLPHATDPDRLVSVRVDATLEQAREAGLQHPNCRDVLVAVFPGLEAVSNVGPVPVPGLYEAESALRAMERQKREWKRRLAVAPPESAAGATARREIRAVEARIREHVAEAGIGRRYYREQLPFADGAGPNPRG